MTTIRNLGKFWQVRENGYTIAQFSTEAEASELKNQCGRFPAEYAGIGNNDPRTLKAHLIKNITIYP